MSRNLNSCFSKIKSLSEHRLRGDHTRPFSDPSPSLLVKNFNSLYKNLNAANAAASDHYSSSDTDIDTDTASTPDIATVFASRRFFFSSPGRSNAIIDSSSVASISASTSPNLPENGTVSGGSIAVPTYSPDPFMDFRRSMQEMVEAHEVHDVRESWDYLHELLMCYLSLNPKSTHKFIVGAFADLLVSLMISLPEKGLPKSDGKCKTSQQYV